MSYDEAIGLEHGAANPRLIDAMIAARRKSTAKAYRLWFTGGVFGVHNFYLGKPVLGGLQVCTFLFLLGMLLIANELGPETPGGKLVAGGVFATLAVLGISLLVDGFLIPARVRAYGERLRMQFEAEADWRAA
jgi:peptidoglycan/LPS O-acetylase OafA/YrhL